MNYELTNLPDTKEYKLEGVPDSIPQLRQAPDPTLAERVFKFFEGADDSEVAAAQLAIVDAERLGISASSAYDHRYAIDEQIKADPKQYSLRSTMLDRFKQSIDTGTKQNQIGELGYKAILSGNEDDINAMLSIRTPDQKEIFLPQSRLEDNMRQAAQMMPMMIESGKEAGVKGVAVGTVLGLGAALMGQPEAIIPMTSIGFKIGGAEGIFESAMRKEAGLAFYDMMTSEDMKEVTPEIKRGAAFGIGVINGVFETSGVKVLLKSIPGANKLFSEAIEKTITSKAVRQQLINIAKSYGETVVKETGIEVAQESTNIVFEALSKELNNLTQGTDIDQTSINSIFERLKDTALQSAKGFSVIGAAGPVMSLAGIRSVSQQDTAMARETVSQTEGKFNGVVLNEEGQAESISVIDPQTGDNLSFDIKSTPEEINQIIETVRNERVQASEGILDDIIIGSTEITDDNIGDVVDTLDVANKNEPPIPKGMTRLYHGSATYGRTTGPAWFSTNKEYAQNYRENAELQYVDYPTDKVNAALDPDNYGQTVERGFTLNIELDSSETGPRNILISGKAINLDNKAETAPIFEALTQNIETPDNAIDQIETLGRAVLNEGITEQQPFMNRMRVVLGDLWEAFKGAVLRAWETLKGETGAIGFDDNVKGNIRKSTGQVKSDAQVSEREALKGGLKKQEKISKQIYKEGVKIGKQQALAPKLETVKGRIARKTGIKQISNMIREDEALKAAFTKAMQAARKAFREGDKEGVAREKQRMREILESAKQREVKRQLISEISNITKKAVNGNIAVDYKKKITELMNAFDSKKLSVDKKAALESLAQYVKDNGVPLGINPKRIQELERLSKKPLSEMTVGELTALKENLKMLKALGKLKAKLSKFADKRDRERRVNALIAGSKNLDTEKSKNKNPSRIIKTGATFKEMTKDFYIETLHTPRVADMIDGFKRYTGLNAKMIKEQLLAEQNANKETINRINKLVDNLEKANLLKELTDEQQIRIMIHIRYQEGAYDAVQSLLNFYGFEIPAGEIINDKNPLTNYVKLSKDEQQLIDFIREVVNEKKFDIASLHEELTNNIFEFVDNYTLPLMYEKSEVDTPNDIIRHDFDDTDNVGNPIYRTKKTFQGFTINRKQGVTKVPRVDIFNIFETAISAQEWYLNMQPVLIDHADLVYNQEYVKAVGETVSNWWKDQIHIVAQKGWKASHTYTGIDKGLRTARQNLNRGVLLYKATTILMQPFAVIDAIAFTMNKYGLIAASRVGKEVTKSLLNWRYAQDIIDTSTALQQRKGGEVAMEEILKELSTKDKIFNNIERVGYHLIQKPDILTASGVRQGVYNTLIEQGINETEAGNEADFIMNMTQGSSNVTMRPHILASGEGYRTLFTFQSFFMNRWGIMVHDLITTGAKGNFKTKLYTLMGLGIFVMGGLGEDEARRRLTNLLRKKDIKSDASLIEEVLLSVPEAAPLLGNMVKSVRQGYDSDSPLGRAGKQFIKGLYHTGSGKIGKGLMELGESILSVGIGIPGISQLFDIFEYLTEQEKGRQ